MSFSQLSTLNSQPVVPPGYKQTEVGVIPKEWEVESGEQITSLIGKGGSPRWQGFEYSDRGMLFVTSENVRDGFLDISEPKFLPLAFHEKLKRTKLQRHDILINLVGASIGRSCQIQQDLGEANVNQAVAVFRVKNEHCSSYIACCFQSPITIDRILEMQVDAARPNISLGDLRRFLIPIPSLPEQCAIAEALSDVDELLGGLDRLIAKKRDIKQAAMQQLLTGQTRLPGFASAKELFKPCEIGMLPDDWEVERVRGLAAITTGSRNTQDRIQEGVYPFFVRSSTIERINSYSFEGEAVLTAGDGVGTGKVFHYINGKFDFHQRVYMISGFSPRLDGRFFFLVFSTRFYDRIMSMTAKSSVDSVRMEMIADMPIPIPSLPEQIAIVGVLSDMEAELAALEQRRDKTRALNQGMMQELLTGKTRLVSREGAKTAKEEQNG